MITQHHVKIWCGPVIAEIMQIEILVFGTMGKHWHITLNISEFAGPIFYKFSEVVHTWVWMTKLTFILCSPKECCCGNQLILEAKNKH